MTQTWERCAAALVPDKNAACMTAGALSSFDIQLEVEAEMMRPELLFAAGAVGWPGHQNAAAQLVQAAGAYLHAVPDESEGPPFKPVVKSVLNY